MSLASTPKLSSERGRSLTQSPLENLYKAYLDNVPFDGQLVENAFSRASLPSRIDPYFLLGKWREFLSLFILLRHRDSLRSWLPAILRHMRQLITANIWSEFQILSAYQTLGTYLIGVDSCPKSLVQMPSGACPADASSIYLWGEVVHPALHAEMGVILAVYASLKGDKATLESVCKIADWQKNTLDHNIRPFGGLFSFEGESGKHAPLINNYFLFDIVGRGAARSDFAAIAERLRNHIEEDPQFSSQATGLHFLLLGSLVSIGSEGVAFSSVELPRSFEDASLAFVGHRAKCSSGVASLCGAGSGFGCFHGQESSVISFGPQPMPLGECHGYGIEGGPRLVSSLIRQLRVDDDGFCLEGAARLVTGNDRFALSKSGGVWIDSRLECRDNYLEVETHFHDDNRGERLLAFSFFVRAKGCLVAEQHAVHPRSLSRYTGRAETVVFQGDTTSLSLEARQPHEEMHVIPLGGGDSFWGADFLVAYVLPPSQKKFIWKVQQSIPFSP